MLKFTLINSSLTPPEVTIVDEPIGWDGLSMRLKRDNTWNGYFDFLDDSMNTLQWHGKAYEILKTAYETEGIEANVSLVVEYKCLTSDTYILLYQGQFVFSKFNYICSDWCHIECAVQNTGCLMAFRNRIEQKVDLDSLQSSDGLTNDLSPYTWLNHELVFPSKTIEYSSDLELLNDTIYSLDAYLGQTSAPYSSTILIYPDFNLINNEINMATSGTGVTQYFGVGPSNEPELFLEFNSFGIQCLGELKIAINIMASLIDNPCGGSWNATNLQLRIIRDKIWGGTYGSEATGPNQWIWNLDPNNFFTLSDIITISDFQEGDKIWLFFLVQSTNNSLNCGPALKILQGSTISSDLLTQCTPTPAKVYMINEVLSRLAEAYTGDCLRVYSDYFGRVDAQPYPSAVNGCGALACITSGLKIRTKDQGFIRIGDSEFTPGFTLSMRECFDALNAIHNIGMGIEPDLVRNDGSDWLRIEPMEYFYRDDVLLTCTGIRELRREFDPTKAFDRATIGYSNWETESVNGLNDVFGKREYRTSLKQLRNLYERLCPFIASDYAIEITRRQYGNTTKDWRYDNDTFIICLRNGSLGTARFQGPHTISVNGDFTGTLQAGDSITISGSGFNNGTFTLASFSFDGAATDMVMVETVVSEVGSSGVLVVDETHPFYTVEQNAIEPGGSTANILYPEYCYNLRITPARNALRHTKTLMSGYGNNWADKQVLFSAGDGNYVAILDLKENDCTIEQDGALLENGNISVDTVIDENSIKPIYTAERVTFEYPVSYEQYKTIKANPYGLIGYQCGGSDVQYGYIEDFSYKPAQGIAEFTLRPKL